MKNKLFKHSHTGKAIALLLVMFFAVALVAGCGYQMDERFAGKWICVRGSADGGSVIAAGSFNFSPKEVFPKGLTIEFTSSNIANFVVDGEESIIKWSVNGDNVTLHDVDDEWNGTINGDFLEFKNVHNDNGDYEGVDYLFAREGTDAMDPIHSLSDAEKDLVGTWVSESVFNLWGMEIQVKGVAISDFLKLTFQPDRSLNMVYKGKVVGDGDTFWIFSDDKGGYASNNISYISFVMMDDGKLNVLFSSPGGFFYSVPCYKENNQPL